MLRGQFWLNETQMHRGYLWPHSERNDYLIVISDYSLIMWSAAVWTVRSGPTSFLSHHFPCVRPPAGKLTKPAVIFPGRHSEVRPLRVPTLNSVKSLHIWKETNLICHNMTVVFVFNLKSSKLNENHTSRMIRFSIYCVSFGWWIMNIFHIKMRFSWVRLQINICFFIFLASLKKIKLIQVTLALFGSTQPLWDATERWLMGLWSH